jgi:hypothetical protein
VLSTPISLSRFSYPSSPHSLSLLLDTHYLSNLEVHVHTHSACGSYGRVQVHGVRGARCTIRREGLGFASLLPRPHLMSIDCRFVRTDRHDDSAAVPSAPIEFSLQGETGGGAGGIHETRVTAGARWGMGVKTELCWREPLGQTPMCWWEGGEGVAGGGEENGVFV